MDPTILIVEDDDDLRYTLAEFLEADGYATLTAASYDEAIGILPRAPVAAVITDLKLGRGRSGWELAAAVAQLSPRPPCIAFTGSEGVEDLIDSGLFADAVEKGDPTLLLATLAQVLRP